MRVENGNLIIEPYEYLKIKKVTGHSFVDLLGLNKFSKYGDALLTLHNVVKEKVDPKYLKRGDFAEKIAKLYYEREGHDCVVYNKDEINYDNFKENKNWGGIIDIEIPNENTLIEVKSKSLKDYDLIVKQPPLAEVYQGMYYAYLRGYSRFKMFWLFFDDQTENEIFAGKKPTTINFLKKFEKEYIVDIEDMNAKIEQVKKILKNFRETRVIPLSAISSKYIELLKTKGVEFNEKQ